MNDYGKGSVLGAATSLPLTSLAAFSLLRSVHPVVVIAFIIVTAVSLIFLVGYIFRFLINRRR